MRRLRLALVVPGGVDRSGVDRVVPAIIALLERLAKRHDVLVFATNQEAHPARWNLLGAEVCNIGNSGAYRRRFLAEFARGHRQCPFDVVHAIWASPLAALAARHHRIPLLTHLAGGEPARVRDIGYGSQCTLRGRAAVRFAVRASTRVTVATHAMAALSAALGVRAEVVPLGVAIDRWPVRAPRPRDAGSTARLLHIGDLRPVKDQATLLSTAARLRAMDVAFELDVAGLDTMNGDIQRLARNYGVAERTRFHGVLRREALRALVDAADLLVVTSRHEAGPLVVLEAAIAGVPTAGTAVGHVADWAGDAAVAVPVGDADTLAVAIAELLRDDDGRMALAARAQQVALAMDADRTAANFDRIYHEILAC